MSYYPNHHSGHKRQRSSLAFNENFLPIHKQTEELNRAAVEFLNNWIPKQFQSYLENLGPLRPTNPCTFIIESAFLLGENPYTHYRALMQMYLHAVTKVPTTA